MVLVSALVEVLVVRLWLLCVDGESMHLEEPRPKSLPHTSFQRLVLCDR